MSFLENPFSYFKISIIMFIKGYFRHPKPETLLGFAHRSWSELKEVCLRKTDLGFVHRDMGRKTHKDKSKFTAF